jgi:hypothetical protein
MLVRTWAWGWGGWLQGGADLKQGLESERIEQRYQLSPAVQGTSSLPAGTKVTLQKNITESRVSTIYHS